MHYNFILKLVIFYFFLRARKNVMPRWYITYAVSVFTVVYYEYGMRVYVCMCVRCIKSIALTSFSYISVELRKLNEIHRNCI